MQVALVRAEDPDAGWFGAIRYSILRGNNEGVFAIEEETGRVTLVMIPARAQGKKYSLTIRASDKVRELWKALLSPSGKLKGVGEGSRECFYMIMVVNCVNPNIFR